MLRYREGAVKANLPTLSLVNFIQGTPHARTPHSHQLRYPRGPHLVWAGAATWALRGHSPCSRQKMPLPQDVYVLDPLNVLSNMAKETSQMWLNEEC